MAEGLYPGSGELRRMMMAIGRIDEAYFRSVRALGMTDHLFVLFYAVADGAAHSQKQICQAWSVPRTTLNTVVQACVKKGYLRLVPGKGREKELVLTDAGRAFADAALAPVFEAESRAYAPADAGLAERLEAFAGRLERAFDRIGRAR